MMSGIRFRYALGALIGLLGSAFSALAAGSLYVSDATLDTVQVFNSTTGALTGSLTPSGGWGLPTGIAVAANGDVFVADAFNDVIDLFNPNGTFNSIFASTGLFSPSALAIGPDGFLYVANESGNSYITRYDSSGNPVDATPFVPANADLTTPSAMTFGADGNLYLGDTGNGDVDQVIRTTGAFSVLIQPGCPSTPFAIPGGITAGPGNALYIADTGGGCGNNSGDGVFKYSLGGNLLSTFVATNILSSPTGLAFGPDGDLYVVDSNGRVARFNASGAPLADFVANGGSSGPLVNPTYLAFSQSVVATPEPAAGGLLIIALCAFGAERRRRA